MVNKHYGIRDQRYKLINFYEMKEWELFDLEKDPHEMTSVYGKPEYADITKRLKKELQELKDKYKDDDSFPPKRKK